MFTAWLGMHGLELRDTGELFKDGNSLGWVSNVRCDGQKLEYDLKPNQPLKYIDITIEVKP